MENSKTGASAAPRASGKEPNIEELLAQGNWEDRVAAARKKREQLQASSPPQKPKLTPRFPEFAPHIVDASDAKPEEPINKPHAQAVPAVLPVPAPKTIPTAPAPATKEDAAAAVVVAPLPEPNILPAPEERRRVDRAVLVAFACFFGIGIGVALGAGLVWSLGGFGGLNRAQIADVAPAPTVDVPPTALQVAFALRPHPGAQPQELGVSLPTPIAATRQDLSALKPAALAVFDGPSVASPGAALAATSMPRPPLQVAALAPYLLQTAPDAGVSIAPLATMSQAIGHPVVFSPLAGATSDRAPNIVTSVPIRAFTEVDQPATPTVAPAPAALPQHSSATPRALAPDLITPQRRDLAYAPQEGPIDAPVILGSLDGLTRMVPSETPSVEAPYLTAASSIDGATPPQVSVALLGGGLQTTTPALIPTAPVKAPTVQLASVGGFAQVATTQDLLELTAPAVTAPTVLTWRGDLSAQLLPALARVLPSVVTLPEVDTIAKYQPSFIAGLGLTETRIAALSLVLNAPGNVEDAAFDARAAALAKTGLQVGALNRVPYKITKPHVRYYNAANADVATALAAKFDVEARDFSKGSSGGPSRIEFWMAGTSATAPAAAKPRKAKAPRRQATRSTPRRVDPRAALRQKLARRLKSGDHL